MASNLEGGPELIPQERCKKTNAEKCRSYREKQKEAKVKVHLLMERQRVKSYRVKQNKKMTEEDRQARKMKESEIRKQYRWKIQHSALSITTTNLSNQTPYKRPQSLGKAVQRMVRILPVSPRKKRAVVAGVAERIGLKVDSKRNENLVRSFHHGPSISEDIVRNVQNFYIRPDISYTMPGMKDEITIWIGGTKTRKRKYYLTMFLREAYRIYIDFYLDEKIGLSKFCALRPQNVLLMHETPPDQCKCRIHENFILKLKGLKIDYDSQTFWENTLCDTTLNSPCWQSVCDHCANGQELHVELYPDEVVTWKVWEVKEIEASNHLKRLRNTVHEGCVAELCELVKYDFVEIVKHINVKRIQAKQFLEDQHNPAVRVLQIDFAMNYSCEYQNEVQSALWSRASVALFTAATIYNGMCKTFLICSDTRDKTKDTVAVFVDHLYNNYLFRDSCSATEEAIWSDGPSSEFKNRYMMRLLQELSRKYKRKFSWKYFATSHGKGIVDGIGGRAKSIVRMEVMSKKIDSTIVQSSKDFARAATRLMDQTTVIHISQKDIEQRINEVATWENVPPVPGIQKMHVACCFTSGGQVQLFENAVAIQASVIVEDLRNTNSTSVRTSSGRVGSVSSDSDLHIATGE